MRRMLLIAFQALLCVAVFLSYSRPIDDSDFWWHLRHGKLLFETLRLPADDAFSFSTSQPESVRTIGTLDVPDSERPSEGPSNFWSVNLSASWLGQLILYLPYLAGGLTGVGIFKSCAFALLVLLIFLSARAEGAGPFPSAAASLLAAYIGLDFNSPRPQIFSLLLFAVLHHILQRSAKNPGLLRGLPPLMLLWANLHGGFILGPVYIFLYAGAKSLSLLFRRGSAAGDSAGSEMGQLWGWGLAAFLASLLNPGGYRMYLFPLEFSHSLFRIIDEYQRPDLWLYPGFGMMAALVVIALLALGLLRRLEITDVATNGALMLLALSGKRYIIFFAVVAGMFLARAFTVLNERLSACAWRQTGRFPGLSFLRASGPVSPVLALASAALIALMLLPGTAPEFGAAEGIYPEAAVSFLRASGISGNMFNSYNWGGYLIWSLYPQSRVFIDGRCLSETALFHYLQVMRATQGPDAARPLWRTILDAYGADLILVRTVERSGAMLPLAHALFEDRAWVPVYADGGSLVLLRDRPEYAVPMARYAMPREKIMEEVLAECMAGIAAEPNRAAYYESLGIAYLVLNRKQEARQAFGRYLVLNPGNENVRRQYEVLKQEGQ